MIDSLNHLTFDNLLNLLSIIPIIIGGIFALIQWNSQNKIKRGEFLNQIISKIRFDKKMAKTRYLIDYNYSWYNENFHNNNSSDIEFSVDKLLSYFDYICYLKKIKQITEKEFLIIQYDIIRIFNSPCVQRYLWNLYHFSEKNNSYCSFKHLIDYGISSNKIDNNEFKNKNNKKYINYKYLNF
jgi:hypothetical protein